MVSMSMSMPMSMSANASSAAFVPSCFPSATASAMTTPQQRHSSSSSLYPDRTSLFFPSSSFLSSFHSRDSFACHPLLHRNRRPATISPHTPTTTTTTTTTTSCQSEPSRRDAVPSAVPFAPPISDVWELDFYSRPVVGLDGKKLWEVIIVDSTGTFEFVDAIPNTLVNSRELRKRIRTAIESAPRKPRVIRFFRTQMLNMIQIALSEIDVAVAATRKTYMLYRVLEERMDKVYSKMPGFKPALVPTTSGTSGMGGNSPLGSMGFSPAQRLPDALRCEKFAFGNFPLGYLKQFFKEADPNDFFGDACLVNDDRDDDLNDDLLIPGIIAFSGRAGTLAAWVNGIDVVFVRAVMERAEVVLECGLNEVYRFVQITDDIREDVRAFQAMKEKAKGLHFLAIQKSPESDEIEGLWLMCQV